MLNSYIERLNLIKWRFNLNSFRHVSCQMFFICYSFVCELTFNSTRWENRHNLTNWNQIRYTQTHAQCVLHPRTHTHPYPVSWGKCGDWMKSTHLSEISARISLTYIYVWRDAVLLVVFGMNVRIYSSALYWEQRLKHFRRGRACGNKQLCLSLCHGLHLTDVATSHMCEPFTREMNITDISFFAQNTYVDWSLFFFPLPSKMHSRCQMQAIWTYTHKILQKNFKTVSWLNWYHKRRNSLTTSLGWLSNSLTLSCTHPDSALLCFWYLFLFAYFLFDKYCKFAWERLDFLAVDVFLFVRKIRNYSSTAFHCV